MLLLKWLLLSILITRPSNRRHRQIIGISPPQVPMLISMPIQSNVIPQAREAKCDWSCRAHIEQPSDIVGGLFELVGNGANLHLEVFVVRIVVIAIY